MFQAGAWRSGLYRNRVNKGSDRVLISLLRTERNFCSYLFVVAALAKKGRIMRSAEVAVRSGWLTSVAIWSAASEQALEEKITRGEEKGQDHIKSRITKDKTR